MQVGDLVEYRGWSKTKNRPLAIVLEYTQSHSDYHKRIRVMWMGETVPIQASVISTTASRISSWVHPKYFRVISESR